ncbi:TetR/AcrR family transcriptional regulator [Paenibacillus dendritiformis]|uniref:TetR/AcrR family transcriptional regulator n=1 Tax=Paenibacillus dendritiformis TaxID=130049 RepID=UPI000DA73803|nr:TetR/AcrR family transcriptional regulator [Paenibacillus dendritiformis]PZM67634.1 TetR/AcrR family transcriptional regulator [Paenibacillus dendritiformis]TDL57133.1 TetR/AcrR family transcriptional regulator [Paenibacillus dendritiformis]WGU95047.1 TetR/AcrR family transcriptional regulator [Paenibacillus dendritiformis]
MPRTHKENERIRQMAKEKIRIAAMELFMKQGYHATSIEDVAKHANISKGLLYNYYKGKEELLSTMIQARIDELIQVMEAASSQESPAEQLKHIVEGAINNVQQKPEVFQFYLHLQTQPESDEVLSKYSKLLIEESARQFHLQCEMFENLGVKEPRKRSLYFSSVLQGLMLMISTYPEQFPVEEMKAQIIHEFCHSSNT